MPMNKVSPVPGFFGEFAAKLTVLLTPHVTAKAARKGTGSHCAHFHKVRKDDMIAVELMRVVSLLYGLETV